MKTTVTGSGAIDLAGKFIARYVKPRDGRTMIVGSRVYGEKEDRRAHFADAFGVDMLDGPGVDRVLDLEEPLPKGLGKFAHVECCSVLEHSRRPWLLAANLQELMHEGATIYLSVPFVWRFHGYPSDYFRFTDEGIKVLFNAIEWQVLMYSGDRLRPDHYLRGADVESHPYLPRTEVLGFGVRV